MEKRRILGCAVLLMTALVFFLWYFYPKSLQGREFATDVASEVPADSAQFMSCEQEERYINSVLQVENPELRQLFVDVLKNQTDFFYLPTGEKLTLLELENDRKASMDEEDREFFRMFSNFTVCDLEQDGVPELILQDTHCFKILRYADEQLSCYNVPYRGMQALKTDGTFRYSGGYRDHGVGRLIFTETHRETKQISWCQSGVMVNNVFVENYQCFVNGQLADEAALLDFFATWDKREEVCWYAYNEDKVNELFNY